MKANGMQSLYGWGMLSPFLALFSAFVVAPLGFGLGLGFFSWDMLAGTPAAWIGLGNYAEAAADPYFWKSLRVTMVFVLFTVPLMVGLATALAFLLDRAGRRQGIYRVALILPMMINLTVIGILWRWFLNQDFGLFNAWLGTVGIRVPWLGEPGWAMTAIVAMTLWWTVGGPAIILLAGLQQVPPQLHEAAAIDGAGPWRTFFCVTLPVLRPVLLFVVVTQVIASFQVFGQTFMVTRGGPALGTRVLVQYIYETAFTNYRMGYGAAMSWLLFLVIGAVAWAVFRLLRSE